MGENDSSNQDEISRLERIRDLSNRLSEISEKAQQVSGEAQNAQLKQMAELIERTRSLIAKFTKQ